MSLYGTALVMHTTIDFVIQYYVWSIFWNLFALGCVRSQAISHQHEIWRAYVPVALGGLVGWITSPEEIRDFLSRYRLPVKKPEICGFLIGVSTIMVCFIYNCFLAHLNMIIWVLGFKCSILSYIAFKSNSFLCSDTSFRFRFVLVR
jgi:hypothetical protein